MPASVGPPVMHSRTGSVPRISRYKVAPGTVKVLVSMLVLMYLVLPRRLSRETLAWRRPVRTPEGAIRSTRFGSQDGRVQMEVIAMAEKRTAKKGTSKSANRATARKKATPRFTAEERAAMKERVRELKAERD